MCMDEDNDVEGRVCDTAIIAVLLGKTKRKFRGLRNVVSNAAPICIVAKIAVFTIRMPPTSVVFPTRNR